MRLAVIENSIVMNVIEGELQNVKPIFPLDSRVVNVDRFPVSIGDSYIDGIFYRDGTVIERVPTEAEEIEQLKVSLLDSIEDSTNIDYRLSLIELGLN